ncbi:unnamed protein product [Rotaria magnacalcarata]|uniref:Uncharacterized protein n=1 Tax=Rotaria magnacalcarata TaxID=392030 RepID=A0A817ABX4_9BILA|nr:unnamed protein product [Rotaria magnacalcarata]CAF3898554.1 unnamed protein product [Rotaria magnacalcarata]
MEYFEKNLSKLSPIEFQAYGMKYATQFEYRVELACRIASNFKAQHLVILDDVALTVSKSERATSFFTVQGCDRSLLPALWLATGFKQGVTIVTYAPVNPIELREFLKIKQNFEQRLNRSVPMRIIYQGRDILSLNQQDPREYTRLCKQCHDSLPPFTDDFHIQELKRHFDLITQGATRSLVFPFQTMEIHRQELAAYTNIVLPDLPTIDKAKHNFLLRKHGFNDLPHLLMVFIDGSVIDEYDVYIAAMARLSSTDTSHNPENVARFSKSIVSAIDRLHFEFQYEKVFLKLDAIGAGGWSCVSPSENAPLYDWTQTVEVRVAYLIQYIEKNVLEEHLPSHAVVEEFIEAQKRPGDIDADYTVCGFVLDSIFYPTSISLCGTDSRGQYIEQWTAAKASQMDDSPTVWQHMFEIYARMIAIEAEPFSYKNGIYAGDIFLTVNNEYKQRDWNIRRGGRSSPETFIMLGEPNYEAKVNISIPKELTCEKLFDLYTHVCDRLAQAPYHMYPFSTAYCYFCKSVVPNFIRINLLIHPKVLLHNDDNTKLPKNKNKQKVYDIVKQIIDDELLNNATTNGFYS